MRKKYVTIWQKRTLQHHVNLFRFLMMPSCSNLVLFPRFSTCGRTRTRFSFRLKDLTKLGSISLHFLSKDLDRVLVLSKMLMFIHMGKVTCHLVYMIGASSSTISQGFCTHDKWWHMTTNFNLWWIKQHHGTIAKIRIMITSQEHHLFKFWVSQQILVSTSINNDWIVPYLCLPSNYSFGWSQALEVFGIFYKTYMCYIVLL
jgi:hypothetical protein